MKLTILGSGAWTGIPAPFCSCAACKIAKDTPASKDNRTRPSFLCKTESGEFLIEVSPDIRLQSTKFSLPSITDFIVSHWHFDHMYGLHELLTWSKKQKEKPKIHCSVGTKEIIDKEFGYLPLHVNVHKPLEPFELFGVTTTPLPVYHMFGRDNEVGENKLENTYGYLLEHNGKRVAYLADYYRIPETTLQKIQNIDALIADGTYLLTNEYKNSKPNHIHGDEILAFTKSIGAKSVYYHSVSHLTQKTHEEMQQMLPSSHFLTYDGLEIIL